MLRLSIFGIFGAALALPQPSYISNSSSVSNGVCTEYTITTTLTSEDLTWALPEFQSNFDVAGYLFNTTRKDAQTAFAPFVGSKNVTKEYTVSATFCAPKNVQEGKDSTVLLATHGLGYDGRYWAPTYRAEEYSFLEYALKNGYSVFYYDRIGTGESGKESGYTNQANNQVAMLSYLASSIRSGKYTANVKAKKLVLVGHSFGSALSNVVAATRPDLVDGVVLTGIAYANASTDTGASSQRWIATAFASRIAYTVDRYFLASDYDSGYLTFGDIYSHVETFFHDYEQDVAKYADSITNPFAAAEYSSLGNINLDARNYKGKVLVTAGEYDLICGGECMSTFDTGLQKTVWKGASVLETYVHPGAGHGVNFNKNATGFYEVIVGFLNKNV